MNPLKNIEQLPLVVEAGQVCYQAEDGSCWPVFGVTTEDTSVADERAWSILQAMLNAYNGTLGHVHNTDECDPDGHVVFVSVCCGARLYRCAATEDGLPSKPLIHQGEDACRSCGEPLAQF